MATNKPYLAGIYRQCPAVGACECDGWHRIVWSRHSREDLAHRAARKYARGLTARSGGSMSWTAWHDLDGGSIRNVAAE